MERKRRDKTVLEELATFEQVHPHKANRFANGKIQVREWVAHSSHPCLHSASVLGILPVDISTDNTRIKGERFVSLYIANAIYCIIWKYRDIAIFRKYRDILTLFSVHDNGKF